MSELIGGPQGFLWLVPLLAVLTVLASLMSALIERSGPLRLRQWAERAGGRLYRLYLRRRAFEVYRACLSLAAKAMPMALVFALAGLLITSEVSRPSLWAVLGSIVIVGAGELLNRILVARASERLLSRLTPVFRLALLATLPLIPLLRVTLPAQIDEGGEEDEEDEATDEEIEAFIELGTKEGILEPEEGEMVWSIVDFGDTEVQAVMTPRIDVAAAAGELRVDELARRFLDSGHSRLPVFEGSIDKIVGVVHLRDVLRAVSARRNVEGRRIAQAPYFIPETKPLDELLKEMQKGHHQMAIVVDEYGGTAGVVTVEDLLEEIVGEIADEHEVEENDSEELADGSWRFDGSVQLEALEKLFGVLAEDEPFNTVGGLVFSVLGYVPEKGEAVEWRGLRVVVEEADDRRVRTVRVETLARLEVSASGDAEGETGEA